MWSDLSCEPYTTLNCPAMLRYRDDRDTDEFGPTIKREKSVFQCPNSQPTCLCFVPILGHSAFKNFLQKIKKPKCRLPVSLSFRWLSCTDKPEEPEAPPLPVASPFPDLCDQGGNALVQFLAIVFKQRHQLLNTHAH